MTRPVQPRPGARPVKTTGAVAHPVATAATPTSPAQRPPAAPAPRAARDAAALPRDLQGDVDRLTPAARGDLGRLLFLHARDPALRRAIIAALSDAALWPVPMHDNDERRVLAQAMAAVPLPDEAARRPH